MNLAQVHKSNVQKPALSPGNPLDSMKKSLKLRQKRPGIFRLLILSRGGKRRIYAIFTENPLHRDIVIIHRNSIEKQLLIA